MGLQHKITCKKGTTNSLANALLPFYSERILALSSTTLAWLLDIFEFYSNDQKAQDFLPQFTLNPNSKIFSSTKWITQIQGHLMGWQ